MIVPPNEYFTFKRKISLSPDDLAAIINGASRLWVFGNVVFRDFLYREVEYGFSRELELVPHKLYEGRDQATARFVYGGHATYNYSRVNS